MAARRVVDPSGRTWRVRRRWVPHTVRWRGPVDLDAAALVPDPGDLTLVDDLGCLPGLGVAVAGVAVVLLAVFLVLPALVFALELVVVVLVVALAALARVVFRRPWTVEARVEGTNEGRQWRVAGWRASGDLVDTVAERIRATGRTASDVTWTS
jgi:hypothetical protein